MTVAENKWVLVTGANRGLGYEAARQLLEAKHPVIVGARTQQKADEAAEKLRAAAGVDSIVQALEIDPASPDCVAAAASKLRATRDGKLGVVVNNAGVATQGWSQQEWDDTMPVNVDGALAVTEALLPLLADGGRVVMVSSGMGQLSLSETPAGISKFPSAAYEEAIRSATTLDDVRAITFDADDSSMQEAAKVPFGYPVYKSSKALLNKAVQLLAKDDRFTSKGISVSAVCPGWCRTDMGTEKATRSAAEGGASIVWNVVHKQPEEINGKFFRDGGELPW